MASATASDSDAYYRVYKALHLVTHEAIPCVDNCLRVWHATQKQTLSPCIGQCPDGKKPKQNVSCSNCLAWGNAVEAVLYQPPTPTLPLPAGPQQQVPGPSQSAGSPPPQSSSSQQPKSQITWSNVNQSNLGKSHVEVGKAFVLRLPNKQVTSGTTTQQYTSVADFDSASLLMIMTRFTDFHQGNATSYEIIKKVGVIRNELSHMGLKDDMQLEDQRVKDYFQDIDDFITSLETLHPQHFTSAQDVRTRLSEIQMEPITAKMKEEMHLQMSLELQSVTQTTEQVKEEVADLKEIVKQIKENVHTSHPMLIQCQNQLRAEYRTNRGGIGFLPGMPKEFPLDDFFVDLTLIKEEKRPTWVKEKELVWYTDLLNLENQSGRRLDHILIRGKAGTGKTTLINKVAYQWATQLTGPQDEGADALREETQCPLNRFQLVFVLDIRKIEPEMDLENCIQEQLLPDMPKAAIKSLLRDNVGKCLFLFDGYDELRSRQDALNSKLLLSGCVIVTTRPEKVDEFCQNYNGYVHVLNSGFSHKSKKAFISKYFDVASNERVMQKENMNQVVTLSTKIQRSYLNALACYPLLLAMMCFMWNETGDIPMRMTALYKQVVEIFAFQSYVRNCPAKSIPQNQNLGIDRILLQLGSASLDGLLLEDIKLIFEKEDLKKIRSTHSIVGQFWVFLSIACLLACVGLEVGLRFGSAGLGLTLALLGIGLGYIVFSIYKIDVIDQAEKLGLLTKVHGKRRGLHMVPQYSFMHRTFQEFCAATYWASLAETDRGRFNFYLRCIIQDNVYDMQNLLRFCCGLSSKAAAAILEYLVNQCELVWQLPAALLFEAESDSQIQPKLHETLRPVTKVELKGILPGSVLELYTILNHYSSYGRTDKKVQTWLANIEELNLSISSEEVYQFLLNTSESSVFSKSLKSLSLTYFSSKHDTIVTCFLKQHLQLRHLKLEVPGFSSESTEAFVKSLYAELLYTPITSPHFGTYFEILIPRLQSLSLDSTNMDSILWERLFDIIIEAGKRLPKASVKAMSGTVSNVQCLPMRKLHLSRNAIFSSENENQEKVLVGKFAEVVSYMSGLEYLGLYSTGLKSAFFHIVSPVISQISNLQELAIHMGKDLFPCLQELRNLRFLDLMGSTIEDDDVGKLPIWNLPYLKKLNLSRSRFGSKGLIALSSSFQHIPQLTVLNLNGNAICEQGAIAFSASLRHLPLLTHLNITLIDTGSYVALSRGFCHIPHLEELCMVTIAIRGAVISVEAADALYKGLVYLPKLDVLDHPPFAVTDLTGTNVNSEVVTACYQEIPNFHKPRYPCCFRKSEILSIVNIVERCSGKLISWHMDLPLSLQDAL